MHYICDKGLVCAAAASAGCLFFVIGAVGVIKNDLRTKILVNTNMVSHNDHSRIIMLDRRPSSVTNEQLAISLFYDAINNHENEYFPNLLVASASYAARIAGGLPPQMQNQLMQNQVINIELPMPEIIHKVLIFVFPDSMRCRVIKNESDVTDKIPYPNNATFQSTSCFRIVSKEYIIETRKITLDTKTLDILNGHDAICVHSIRSSCRTFPCTILTHDLNAFNVFVNGAHI